MKDEHLMHVLLAPHVSEKSAKAEAHGQYVFKVAKHASKFDIKKAVELLFKVEVTSVQVSQMKPKRKRFGRSEGFRKSWKKAFIKLKEGSRIDLAGSQV
jgi:large subunit ribosomal protein L23